MEISPKAREILEKINQFGQEAYLVGGCVRDQLLGRPVHDWDMTTSAKPEEIMEIFPKTVATGLAHGTVTVLHGGQSFEVTTFRTDGGYEDGRHPSQVAFVPDLTQDLARRDFTINAMAMDLQGQITDLYGGRADLAAGQIRCVGEPVRRFSEDALRMLRGVRFAAQLGFQLEPATWQAMVSCAPLCQKLSAERVRDELEKTLLSPDPAQVGHMVELGLLAAWIAPQTASWESLAKVPANRLCRWAKLVQILPDLSLKTLRLDKKTVEICQKSAKLPAPETVLDFKQVLAKEGEPVATCLAGLWGKEQVLAEILASGHCTSLKTLAISGKDLPHIRGKALGRVLQGLLTHVLSHPQDNEPAILRHLADKIEKNQK